MNTLKSNQYLYNGILTGVTRISKESIYNGLNNITIDTIFDRQFSHYVGITKRKPRKMLSFGGNGKIPVPNAGIYATFYGNVIHVEVSV